MAMEEQQGTRGAIILGGGVGPMAGVKLHEKIITFTRTSGRDQDHIDVIHISRASRIADRTGYLLGLESENPGTVMGILVVAETARFQPGVELPPLLCAAVPCNTFHAPAVWDAFLYEIEQAGRPIKPVHMLDACRGELQERLQKGSKIGILSTTGTARIGVWKDQLKQGGFTTLEVDKGMQERVHQAIYDPQWGIKSETPPSHKAITILQEAASSLASQGAEAIILGCTEIPLALKEGPINGVLQIDPVSSLARALIRAAGGVVKEFGAPKAEEN